MMRQIPLGSWFSSYWQSWGTPVISKGNSCEYTGKKKRRLLDMEEKGCSMKWRIDIMGTGSGIKNIFHPAGDALVSKIGHSKASIVSY